MSSSGESKSPIPYVMTRGKIKRSKSLDIATDRIEVCHLFGSSRPIWLVQQMRKRRKVLNQLGKLFRENTKKSGNKQWTARWTA